MNVEENLLNYFLSNRTPAGLVLDRASDRNTVSVAATGFGMDCWAIAAQRGLIGYTKAVAWVRRSLDVTLATSVRGWLTHFSDAFGAPLSTSEVSTIDTAIFFLGAQQAVSRLHDRSLSNRVRRGLENVDLSWAMGDGYFCHGYLHGTRLPHLWDGDSEDVMLYRLFDIEYKPRHSRLHPLFVYYYPLCFFDDPALVRRLRAAVREQKRYFGHWGVTSCDGPGGYECRKGLVSPLAIYAVSKYVPESREYLGSLGCDPLVGSLDIQSGWKSEDQIGIDRGSAIILRHGR